MSYVKTTWANGDTITASGLNNMENGIEAASAGGILPVTVTWAESGDGTIPKAQIDAIKAAVPYGVRMVEVSDGVEEYIGIAPLNSYLHGDSKYLYCIIPLGDTLEADYIFEIGESVTYSRYTFTLDGDVYKYTYTD